MDVGVAEAVVGCNGYFWVHYLIPAAAAAVGAVPEVVGAEAVSAVEVSVGAVAVDSAAALVAGEALVVAAPAAAGRGAVLFGICEFC